METKQKNRYYSIMFLICIFLLSTSVAGFISLFIKNIIIIYFLEITFRTLFIIYAFYYIKKNELTKPNFGHLNNKLLLLLPFWIICFSNFAVAFYNNCPINNDISIITLIKEFILCLLISFSEELIFRVVLLDEIKNNVSNKILSMLYSSLIFGGIHLLNISSLSTILPCLVQSVYATVIGLISSLIYTYSKNFYLPFIFHFSFNFFNDSLVSILYNISWDLSFYIINIIIGIIILLYGFLIALYLNKKEEL